jgi:hypothetical protein
MKLFQTLLVSAVSLSLIPTAAVNALTINTIDNLTTTQSASDSTSLSTTVDIGAGSSTIFPSTLDRTLDLTIQNAPATAIIQGNVPLPGSGNPGLSFSNGDGTDGLLTLTYGITTPTDFTQGGADRISIGLVSSDLIGASVTVILNGVSETISFLPVAPPEQVLDFLFSSFAGVDPILITDFAIIVDPVLEGDISVTILETRGNTTATPEPATVLGLLAVGLTGRVLRKAKK